MRRFGYVGWNRGVRRRDTRVKRFVWGTIVLKRFWYVGLNRRVRRRVTRVRRVNRNSFENRFD